MRTGPGLLVGVLLLAGCADRAAPGSSCAPPSAPRHPVTVSPGTAAPGDTVTVTASGLSTGCADTGDPDDVRALTGVPVTFVQADLVTELARVDAGDDYAVRVEVVVPEDAAPGTAAIALAHDACPALLVITGAGPEVTVETHPQCPA